MAISKRSREGYLLVDNTLSGGVPLSVIAAAGKDPYRVIGAGVKYKLESATVTCSHCNAIVVLNPDRTRERGYCAKCDAYICDNCSTAALTLGCIPFKKKLDDAEKQAFKAMAANPSTIFTLRKD